MEKQNTNQTITEEVTIVEETVVEKKPKKEKKVKEPKPPKVKKEKKVKEPKVKKEKKVKEPKEFKEKTPTNKRNIIEWTCMSVAIFFWVLSFLRVPFVGTFLDSVFFEFTVGFAKYPLYALTFVYILCIKLPKLRSIFCNRKRIAWYFIPIFLLVIILNTVDCFKQGYDVTKAHDLYMGSSGYIPNWEKYYWYGSVTSFSGDYGATWLPQSYAWGGILGLVIVFTVSYFSPVLLIIVLVILFIVLGLIFFSKKYKDRKVRDVMDNILKKDTSSEHVKKIKDEKQDHNSISA